MAAKRKITIGYLLFYLLFSPDFWQLAVGVLAAWGLGPAVITEQMPANQKILLTIMLATIGYAAAMIPARAWTRFLKKKILGDSLPR